jgi:hypothetical protein
MKRNDAEDFASWGYCYYLTRKRKGQKAYKKTMFCDYVRQILGDNRRKSARTKKNLKFRKSLASVYEYDIGSIAVKHGPYDKIIDYDIPPEGVFATPLERAIFVLKGKWGFTGPEIAHLFGVSPNRISQLYQCFLTRIRNVLIKKHKNIINYIGKENSLSRIVNQELLGENNANQQNRKNY